jgi:hypothetical protein
MSAISKLKKWLKTAIEEETNTPTHPMYLECLKDVLAKTISLTAPRNPQPLPGTPRPKGQRQASKRAIRRSALRKLAGRVEKLERQHEDNLPIS